MPKSKIYSLPFKESEEEPLKGFDSLPDLITVREFAAFVDQSEQTIRNKIKAGEISGVQIGRRLYVLKEKFLSDLKTGRYNAVPSEKEG